MSENAILSLNGKLQSEPADYFQIVTQDMQKIAADGGALLLEEIGFYPGIVIGDLDSISNEKIKEYNNKGIELVKYPVEKDKTDAELALDYCKRNNINNIKIIGALGGRIDQQLGNIFLLEYALENKLNAVLCEPGLEAGLINNKKIFADNKNFCLSLIPISRKVTGVSISGCKYTVKNHILKRYKTRGISNKINSNMAEINLEEGLLLYILKNCTD